MKYYSRKIIICALLLFIFVLSTSAATLSEMRENGEVSDGGITYGDERDGIVSDVSDNRKDMTPRASKNKSGSGGSVLGDIGNDISRGIGDMGRDIDRGIGDMARSAGDTGSGVSVGLIIAILVVIAVLVIIFIMLPKRK